MKILFEDYQYKYDDVEPFLSEHKRFKDKNNNIAIGFIGYVFNKDLNDFVFFLPKVLLDKDGYFLDTRKRPEEIISTDEIEHRDFIYEFSVWIYRALKEYDRLNPDNTIVLSSWYTKIDDTPDLSSGTLIDIILSMIQYNEENKDFFLFTIKNIHSGYNKINWTKSITKTQPFLQDETPLYLNPVNKKKQIDFDEELFVIFFSILNYVNEKYHFSTKINCNYELITGEKFQNYLDSFGRQRLLQIKYKYFSDKLLQMWKLCYYFFDKTEQLTSANRKEEDFLLVKDFNIVFESMIDELLSDKEVLKGLKEQKDGKIVDHIYPYMSLTNNQNIYYIGDSKYYKIGNEIGANSQSTYKQYTYVKNVIQYNFNLFFEGKYNYLQYRDALTEGYNITPNFFISASVDKERVDYENDRLEYRNGEDKFSRQFENRLFDRDTLILSHYNINFLFVLALYASDCESAKKEYKVKARKLFKDKITDLLEEHYAFYILKVKGLQDLQKCVDKHFRLLTGKIFKPYSNSNLLYMALEKPWIALGRNQKINDEDYNYAKLFATISEDFFIYPNTLRENPCEIVKKYVRPYEDRDESLSLSVAAEPQLNLGVNANNNIDFELCRNDVFLLGCYKSEEHKQWIHDRKLYNVRLDKERKGSIDMKEIVGGARFLILYDCQKPHTYEFWRLGATQFYYTKEDLEKLFYPQPDGDFYFVYELIEEFDSKILGIESSFSKDGSPIYKKGREL
ncbi:MAG: restriction endonuclease [Paludibacteraceae bacterium]|nr:restriction endonuclease [Paludibacteraceae bacterium]